jgi:hypothetical protein
MRSRVPGVRPECFQDVDNDAHEIAEENDGIQPFWSDPVLEPTFQRYLEIDRWIYHLHTRNGLTEGKSNDRCCRLDVPLIGDSGLIRPVGKGGGSDHPDIGLREVDGRNSKGSMFVGNIHSVKLENRLPVQFTQSFVRLAPLDFCLNGVTQGIDPPLTVIFEVSVAPNNREHEGLLAGRRVFSGLVDSDLVDNVVEGASKVVNAVPDYQAPSNEIVWSVKVDADPILAEISIVISEWSIGLVLGEGLKFPFEHIEVLVSPSDLEPRGVPAVDHAAPLVEGGSWTEGGGDTRSSVSTVLAARSIDFCA